MNNSNSKNNIIFGSVEKACDGEIKISKGRKGLSRDELELALAVILVDIASSDESFDPSEYEVISSGLKRTFGTTKDRVKQLVNQSKQILDSLRGTSKYTDQLRDNLTEPEREAVFSVIQDLIEADGKEDPFEIYMRSRLAKALGVTLEEKS